MENQKPKRSIPKGAKVLGDIVRKHLLKGNIDVDELSMELWLSKENDSIIRQWTREQYTR